MDHQRNMHDLLCATLRDVYRLEGPFSEAIGRAAAADLAKTPEAIVPFSRIQQESSDQAARLKLAYHMVNNTANDPPPEMTDWLTSALQDARNSDNAGYETLIAWVRLLEERQAAALREENLQPELSIGALIAALVQAAANQNGRAAF